MTQLDTQMFGLSKSLKKGEFDVVDFGAVIPAAVMLHDLGGLQPLGCRYMNNWGCEHLQTSVEEINQLGEEYYEKYFVKEESLAIFQGMTQYLFVGDFDKQYNFFQRVKVHGKNEYTWFYTVCKMIKIPGTSMLDNKIILLASPIIGMNNVISRVTKALDQDEFISRHYRVFADLTQREKEIITLLTNGRSSAEIADQLFISLHTVSTHRKNIIRKTACKSFAELLRFAIAFDLVD